MAVVKGPKVLTVCAYIAFLGLFVLLYARDEGTRGHGRRGLMLFLGETLVFILADIARVRLALSPFPVFGLLAIAVVVVAAAFIARALAGDGRNP